MNVQALRDALPRIPAKDLKFAASLVAAAELYGDLTPKQKPWVKKLLERAEPVADKSFAGWKTVQVPDVKAPDTAPKSTFKAFRPVTPQVPAMTGMSPLGLREFGTTPLVEKQVEF